MIQLLHKIFLVSLVLSLSSLSIELSFITSIVVLMFCTTKMINPHVLVFSLLILVVNIIGFFSTNWFEHTSYDLLKDIIYFIRPLIVLLASYFVVKKINTLNYVFNIVVIIGLFFAVKHLLILILNSGSIITYLDIRRLGGKHNHVELIALIFILFTPFVSVYKKRMRIIKIVLLVSILLYISRTMFLVFLIFYMAYKGYLILNRRFFKGVLILGLASIIFGLVISNIDTTRDSVGINQFIYKTQNSFSELFAPLDINEVKKDRRLLWEHWRAYEALKAIEQTTESGVLAWLFGNGYGSQVDLGTYVYLDGNRFTEVPSIHNGYVYILFKTGILGLGFYVLSVLIMFFTHQKSNPRHAVLNNMIIASCLYLIFTSFVVTGFFRVGEFSMFLFGILLATRDKLRYDESYIPSIK